MGPSRVAMLSAMDPIAKQDAFFDLVNMAIARAVAKGSPLLARLQDIQRAAYRERGFDVEKAEVTILDFLKAAQAQAPHPLDE